ncbi:penicillin acylase family protein [Aestuariibacter sp. A3R04]|uniref:penicillin acylase family protein n=1 Tax=Aestuariibacter sp. A3R04 TaxID=2841571 RepID=UPI00209007BD|nr:penicillin acylase family protein [Aestuariibacter sp. A3R04]
MMLKVLKISLTALLAISVLLGLTGWVALNASLPTLDATILTSSVKQPATLSRDHQGYSVIHSATLEDAIFALGLAHGQDRFFQMDLLRRSSAGELAAWFGTGALPLDKQARFHQFRKRAGKIYAAMSANDKQLLRLYADGVNRAIGDNWAPPPEYLVTRFRPVPWKPEDSILVAFAMYVDLQQGQIALDLARTGVKEYYGQQMLDFLTAPSPYQAALDGSTFPVGDVTIPPRPSLTVTSSQPTASNPPLVPSADIGSNNWAVSGSKTKTGAAMLANDMHLGLNVPTIWYRAQLNYVKNNQDVMVTGVSLPGLPGIVVGTNNHVAWGFTNANLDNVDWIELSDDDATWQESSSIDIANAGTSAYEITMSKYGPVRSLDGKRFALHWVAYEPYAFNLAITTLDDAKTVDEAINVIKKMRLPVQNVVIADKKGSIAWTPGGAVFDRVTPSFTARKSILVPHNVYRADNALPVIKNPTNGRLWTANARVMSTQAYKKYGDGGYSLGARGYQIKTRLLEKDTFSEQDFYHIQLDNEARFMTPWHTLLVNTLKQRPDRFKAQIEALENWQQCACADSVGYTLVAYFRDKVISDLLSPVLTPLKAKHYQVNTLLRKAETAVWALLDKRPADWLPRQFNSWDNFLIFAYEQTEQRLFTLQKTRDLSALRWGTVNALTVQHPLANQVPALANLLNMPKTDGFGDSFMPAVQGQEFGASQRLFVQPGHLDSAILTLPGGQSGHFLSPYYRQGFDGYVSGKPVPLLPGDIKHTLTLLPQTNE